MNTESPHNVLDHAKDEIRLLELQPGTEDSDIQVKLVHVSLQTEVEYEALSYTWGDPHLVTPIEILSSSDPSTSFTFNATQNLVSALRSLRSSIVTRTLWVDAICINQTDNGEKGHQVRLMGIIFNRAVRVIVYVGGEENHSNEVMHLIAQNPRNLEDAFDLLSDEDWVSSWRAMTMFVQRPYFSRYWTVQEVALAHDITLVCGTLMCDWLSFILITRALITETYIYSTNRERPRDLGRKWTGNPLKEWDVPNEHFFAWFQGTRNIMALEIARYSWEKISLKNFLAIMDGRAVTDPRDGVYSILGMAKNIDPTHWDIDYDKKAVDVFLDGTENIIRSTGSLDIICHSNWSDEHEHGCSWVPRFAGGFGDCGCEAFLANSLTISEILLPDSGTMTEINTDISPYSAAGGTTAKVAFDKLSRKIMAKGMIIDKVTEVLDLPESYRGGLLIPKQWKEKALAFRALDDEEMSEEARTKKNFETFWRVLVADRNQVELEPDELDIDLDSLNDFNDIFNQDQSLFRLYRDPAPMHWGADCEEWLEGDMTVPDTSTAGFLKGVVAYIRSKRYIIMENFMGLGPEATKEEDFVCVLFGCSVPVLLRPSKSSLGEYHLVGEAYVHGVMDGEIIEKLNAGEYKIQELSII
ncbi:hypothetical protein EG329_010690 [Mollisiaceae sp. DMI_Dod_QoI]|nr:hypothetical protein EG329_010690 [Helotiales sp. DMI_Dod_QoI]